MLKPAKWNSVGGWTIIPSSHLWCLGSWTYGGLEVDLKHKDEHLQREEQESVLGIEGEYLEAIWVVDEG